MRLPSTFVVLVILVSLAGCGSVFGIANPDSPEFAPGVTTERVINASTLDAANRAILQNTSYSYVRNYTQRIESDGYRYEAIHDTRVWVAANGSFLYHHHGVVTSDERGSEYVDGVWANESVAVMRSVNVENESVTYSRYRPPEPYPAANTTKSGIAGALENATATTTWNESGVQYVHVRRNESETRHWQAPNGTSVNLTSTHTTSATIREDGFVPSINTSVTGVRPLPAAANDSVARAGRPLARINDSARIRYVAPGSTHVPRPDWVEDALAATEETALGETTGPQGTNRTA